MDSVEVDARENKNTTMIDLAALMEMLEQVLKSCKQMVNGDWRSMGAARGNNIIQGGDHGPQVIFMIEPRLYMRAM